MKSVGLTGGIGLGSRSPPGLGERMTVGLTGGIGTGQVARRWARVSG